jgi:tetratricopeptide (TPR) repeat protein
MSGILHMNLGATFVRRNELETAHWHLHASQTYFDQVKSRDFLPELHRYFAEAALLAQNLTEAEAQGQQALSLSRELTTRGEEGQSLRVLGQIASIQAQHQQAEHYLLQSLAILEEVGDEYAAARSRLILAQVYFSQAKTQPMLQLLDQCISVFERLDAVLDLATARALSEKVLEAI